MFNGYHYLIVGGTFDGDEGKPSGFIAKLADAIACLVGNVTLVNGGNWMALARKLPGHLSDKTVVFWGPNVSNDEEKMIRQIKDLNPACFLVSTKRNYGEGDAYTRLDLVARALKTKSNLLLELTQEDGKFASTLIDPLGNTFCEEETDLAVVALALVTRMTELTTFTRVGSRQVDLATPAPDMPDFYQLVRDKAEVFHGLIHAVHQDRFLGNASFRCPHGFPSMRHEGLIFVSRRNLDKRLLGPDGFVAVNPQFLDGNVCYHGEHKPSVDTPIQVALYNYYPNVKYMVHSHTYVRHAMTTERIIPCGAMEEFLEIVELYQDRRVANMVVNLRGHGSLIMADNLSFISDREHCSLHEEGALV